MSLSFAIISDIHGNLEALTAVLEDIDRRGIKNIVCLGDIVGYGPNPVECVDLGRSRCKFTICGNHDEALIKGPWGFNQLARDAIEYHQKLMRPRFYRLGSGSRWKFIEGLPLTHEWEGYLFVHGSPRDPTSEYVLPQQVAWPPPGMFEEIFAAFSKVCFVGHTHVPGIFCEGPSFVPESELNGPFRYEGEKMLINVGSVGQPRDRNWRACYISHQDDQFEYHRLEYPIEETQRKIRAIDDLDDKLGDRLAEGE
ncbi:MAG: metallophosphoesterase [Planctomycetota bacterium]